MSNEKVICTFAFLLTATTALLAQLEPNAGRWTPWFISAGKEYRLPPSPYKSEIAAVLLAQQHLDATALQQILFWKAGAPAFRWQEVMNKLWPADTGKNGVLANMLLGTAIYDATVAAWHTKYAYKRPRPFEAGKKIRLYAPRPEYPPILVNIRWPQVLPSPSSLIFIRASKIQ